MVFTRFFHVYHSRVNLSHMIHLQPIASFLVQKGSLKAQRSFVRCEGVGALKSSRSPTVLSRAHWQTRLGICEKKTFQRGLTRTSLNESRMKESRLSGFKVKAQQLKSCILRFQGLFVQICYE